MPHPMTKVVAPLGDKTITLFRDPSQPDEGSIYFTAKEGADALGLDDYRAFLRLVRAHRDELVEGEEIVAPSATIGGKGRDAKLFRISVLDLLGPLTKSEAGKKIRRWTADIRQRFRRGESAEITREQFDALRLEVAGLRSERDTLRLAQGNASVDLRLALEANAGMSKLAAQILTTRRAEVRHEREVELFADRPNLFAGAPLTEIDERVIAALHLHGPFDSVGALAKHLRVGVARQGDSISTLAARRAIRRSEGKIALVPQPVAKNDPATN